MRHGDSQAQPQGKSTRRPPVPTNPQEASMDFEGDGRRGGWNWRALQQRFRWAFAIDRLEGYISAWAVCVAPGISVTVKFTGDVSFGGSARSADTASRGEGRAARWKVKRSTTRSPKPLAMRHGDCQAQPQGKWPPTWALSEWVGGPVPPGR